MHTTVQQYVLLSLSIFLSFPLRVVFHLYMTENGTLYRKYQKGKEIKTSDLYSHTEG